MHGPCILAGKRARFAHMLRRTPPILQARAGGWHPMGPYPHDAPRAVISDHNPMGTDGFGFVEYAHPEPKKLHALFRQMGFTAVARHRSRAVTLYRQGD